jgi:hypothetical protein
MYTANLYVLSLHAFLKCVRHTSLRILSFQHVLGIGKKKRSVPFRFCTCSAQTRRGGVNVVGIASDLLMGHRVHISLARLTSYKLNARLRNRLRMKFPSLIPMRVRTTYNRRLSTARLRPHRRRTNDVTFYRSRAQVAVGCHITGTDAAAVVLTCSSLTLS